MSYVKILSFYMVISSVHATDWCSLTCRNGAPNTMCIYQPQTQAQSCSNIQDTNTPEKRQKMLDLHNRFRDDLAGGKKGWPSAGDMRLMSWDPTLEEVALRWAVQCIMGHDSCRRTPEFEAVGQNWAMHPQGVGASFDMWVSEINVASPNMINNFGGQMQAGHFTQVIWAKSYKLGCSEIQANQGMKIVVCNYGPAGNFMGERLYTMGNSASQCPSGTQAGSDPNYPSLCGVQGENNKQPNQPVEQPTNQPGEQSPNQPGEQPNNPEQETPPVPCEETLPPPVRQSSSIKFCEPPIWMGFLLFSMKLF